MSQTSQREKMQIIVAAVVVFVLVSFVIWRPLIRTWRQSSQQHVQKKQRLAIMEAALARQPEYEKKYEELLKTIHAEDSPSPVPNILAKVQQLATESGVTIRTQQPEAPKEKGGFVEAAVQCSADANIESLVRFLYGVKKAQDLLDVTELKITPTPANPSGLRADFRVASLSVK